MNYRCAFKLKTLVRTTLNRLYFNISMSKIENYIPDKNKQNKLEQKLPQSRSDDKANTKCYITNRINATVNSRMSNIDEIAELWHHA